MSIQTCVHQPSGEVIIILTRTDGLPCPIRLSLIRGIWPTDSGMTVEIGRCGYDVINFPKDLYNLLVEHGNTEAYWGPSRESIDDGWPSWITKTL